MLPMYRLKYHMNHTTDIQRHYNCIYFRQDNFDYGFIEYQCIDTPFGIENVLYSNMMNVYRNQDCKENRVFAKLLLEMFC